MIARIQENTVIITSDIDGWLYFLQRLLSVISGSIDHVADTYLGPELGDLEKDSLPILLVRKRDTNKNIGSYNINYFTLMAKKVSNNGIEIYGIKDDLIYLLREIIGVMLSKKSKILLPVKELEQGSMELMISVLSEIAGE